MSSTNKTDNILLNQYVPTDKLEMADYNADMNLIDAAVKANQDAIATSQDDITTLESRPSCRVYKTAMQSIPSATDVVLTFDIELFDTGDMHSNSVNNDRITIVEPGIYLIVGHVGYVINSSGYRAASIRKNGVAECQVTSPATTEYTLLNPSALIKCVAGDYLQLITSQNSGVALNVIGNNYTCSFSAVKVAN